MRAIKIVEKDRDGVHILPGCSVRQALNRLYELQEGVTLEEAPDTHFIELPCNVGDTVWCIRELSGRRHIVSSGKVAEIVLTEKDPYIVVRHLHKGYFGKTVFHTFAEASAALERTEKHND